MKDAFKNIRLPHVFVLLTGVIFFCAAASYVIPSGEYKRETKTVSGITRTLVIPGTFSHIDKDYSLRGIIIGEEVEGKAAPVSLLGFLSAIPRGLESAADIIFFIFIIGGVFGILQRTGTISAFLQKLLKRFSHKPNLLIIILMLSVAAGASTLGMGEEFLPLIPLFLIVSRQMGYDRIFGVAIVWIAAQAGFAAATTNPFTVQIAQNIAEVPLNSGILFRLIFFTIIITTAVIYLLKYGKKIKADPSSSVMPDDNFKHEEFIIEEVKFTRRHLMIIITGVILFISIIFSVQYFGWWMNEMSGGFILLGIICIIISKMKLADALSAFVKGMEEMTVAALVVGFAKGVQVVLEEGQILDTVIHSAAVTLQHFPGYIAAGGMLIFQTTINFLIPSGSGQAAVTMPLMAPLSDLVNVTRQTAVFAFTCGDGFSNMIIPTSGLLMAVLSLAKVPFTKWLKFIFPLFLIFIAVSLLFLTIAVFIEY